MFSKLAVFSAAVLATVANADFVFTPYTTQNCSGTAGLQVKEPTNVCVAAQGVSAVISCKGNIAVQDHYFNANCSGQPAYVFEFKVGHCVALQDVGPYTSAQDGQYLSAYVNMCS